MILSSKKSLEDQAAKAGAFSLFGMLFSGLLLSLPAHILVESLQLYAVLGFITFFSLFYGLLCAIQVFVSKVLVSTGVLPEGYPLNSKDASPS